MPDNIVTGRFAPRRAVFGRDGARRRATPGQYALALAACAAAGWALKSGPALAVDAVHLTARWLFATAIALRLVAVAISRRPADPLDEPDVGAADGPVYTLIAPLYQEAEVVPGLVRALERLDWPRSRLQLIFALEADDAETRAAVARHAPWWSETRIAPANGPRTKPHACNAALARARGDYVVVYDAEDRPDPGQLREAAARFAEGPPELVCLQAPLRVLPARDFLRRQFAMEYAALFETTLPALARAGLPFPLGGTSNHFRRAALEAVGGWDAFNVTEDADVGLRLAACGGRLGVLSRPTWEPAPSSLHVWTPQRTRWIKGHLHTWIVHMRRPWRGGLRSFFTLQVTLGLNVATALLHGPMAMGVAATLLLAAVARRAPQIEAADAALLLAGWASAALAMAVGARRAGLRWRGSDLVLALAYWPLQSLAGAFAVYELARRPHHWNKTPHDAHEEGEAVAAA